MSDQVCRTCNQPNQEGMAFCIFCGGSLKAGNPTGRSLRPAPDACSSCGSFDELNAQYCVNCGASMVPRTEIAVATPTAPALGDARRGAPLRRRAAVTTAASLAAALALGAAVGTGAAWLFQHCASTAAAGAEKGLLVFTGKPYAGFTLQASDRRRYLSGRAAADGILRLPDLDSGQYILDLENARYAGRVTISGQHGEILGSPDHPLLSQSPQG